MQYMGGKARIAKKLTEVMLSMTTERTFYLEPFMGGAWVLAQMAPHFSAPAAGDAMPDVALMWQAVQQGWVPPTEMSRERWYQLKDGPPCPEKTFAGFGCSFGGKWFGGYAADNHKKHIWQAGKTGRSIGVMRPSIVKTFISQGDYRRWIPGPGTVVYCDPPYDGTTSYAGAIGAFDSAQFWVTMEKWFADGATVFVSEYVAPSNWRCVWSQPVRAQLAADANAEYVTEKLFTL